MATIDVTIPISLNKIQADQAVALVQAWNGAVVDAGIPVTASFAALIGITIGMCRTHGVPLDAMCEAIRETAMGNR